MRIDQLSNEYTKKIVGTITMKKMYSIIVMCGL